MKKTTSLFEKVWLAAPIAVWFSFQPLIRLGQSDSMYFELSIALLYVLILAVSGIPLLWVHRRMLLKSRAVWLTGAFVGVMVLSLLWTPNLVRGVLTTGVAGLLFMIFMASRAIKDTLRTMIPTLAKLFFISAVVVAGLALVQFFAGIWLEPEITLLCAGCVAEQFGFVRPNVFTIEPQFLGNMLLAPALLGVWLGMTGRLDRWAASGLGVIVTALFLTLSRGAILAFVIGLLVLGVVYYRQLRNAAAMASLVLAGFLVCLVLQGTAAALNPRVEESFMGAVSKSVNQLSLGVITIPTEAEPEPAAQSTVVAPVFDGYVEESTNVRLSLSSLAISVWASNPVTALFGVGIGGAGVALSEAFPAEFGPREIVQNEYIAVLLELGLLGSALFVAILAVLVYRLGRAGMWVGVAISAAFLTQWSFFSGYPNLLHVYLILILCAVYSVTAHRGRLAPATQY